MSEKLGPVTDSEEEMINLGNDRSGRPIVVGKKWLDEFRIDWESETVRGFERLLSTRNSK